MRWLSALLLVLLSSFLQIHSYALSTSTFSTTSNLPPSLHQAVSKGLLVQPRPNVYLLGTVHIGSESADEAKLLINTVQPKAVIVEVAPSRLETVRRQNEAKCTEQQEETDGQGDTSNDEATSAASSAAGTSPTVLLRSLPALAEKGWSTGGLGGLLFAVTIVWGSLLKRWLTANEESDTLPRVDEFATAIEAADAVGSSVVACDVEIEDLIGNAARSLSPIGWLSLGANIAAETAGLRETDPIRRRRGETVLQWAARRRDIQTARASRIHGEDMARGLSRVLVDERDERFARYCSKVIEKSEDTSSSKDEVGAIVCVIGLVHLDGVAKRLQVEDMSKPIL